MAYSKYVLPLDVTVVLAYIGNVVNMGGDYSYNYTYGKSITTQAQYEASGWYSDARPQPSWATIVSTWPTAVAYYNVLPTDGQNIANDEAYLGGELATVLASKQDALPTGGNSGQYVGGDLLLHTLPTGASATFATPTFANITTATMLSVTQKSFVSYDIDAVVNIALLAGQSVTATLTYADNSAMTTNPVIVSSQLTNNSGVLGLTTSNTLKVSGFVPPNKYRKVSFVVTGGATTPGALKAGQEVLM